MPPVTTKLSKWRPFKCSKGIAIEIHICQTSSTMAWWHCDKEMYYWPFFEGHHEEPVMLSFDIFFDVSLNKLSNKQLSFQWFKTPIMWYHSKVLQLSEADIDFFRKIASNDMTHGRHMTWHFRCITSHRISTQSWFALFCLSYQVSLCVCAQPMRGDVTL